MTSATRTEAACHASVAAERHSFGESLALCAGKPTIEWPEPLTILVNHSDNHGPVKRAMDHLASMSPERRAELDQEWK